MGREGLPMVFLSSYSAVAKLSYLIADSVILGTVGWKVMRFGELEDDHLNPTDFSREVNRIFPFEVAMHVGLTAWLFMHLELWLVLVNLPYLAWTISMYLDKSYFVDASQVYTPAFKKSSQTKILIAAGFFSIMWLVYMTGLILTLIHVGHDSGAYATNRKY